MDLRPPRRAWVSWIAAFGILHFAIAIALWIIAVVLFCDPDHPESLRLACLQAWPCLPLFAAFAWALALNLRRRPGARLILSLALLAAAGAFVYDVHTQDVTIRVLTKDGCRHTYFNWWWYEGPGPVDELTHWLSDAVGDRNE